MRMEKIDDFIYIKQLEFQILVRYPGGNMSQDVWEKIQVQNITV